MPKPVKALTAKQQPRIGGIAQDTSSVKPLLHQQQQTHSSETQPIPWPPKGREPASAPLSRPIDAHTHVIKQCRASAEKAGDAGDSGTDDLLVSQVLRTNELQVWFLSEHLVAASPV